MGRFGLDLRGGRPGFEDLFRFLEASRPGVWAAEGAPLWREAPLAAEGGEVWGWGGEVGVGWGGGAPNLYVAILHESARIRMPSCTSRVN